MGPRFTLTETEESVLVDILTVVAKWGCPFELYQVRCMVRDYLNDIKRKVEKFGPSNMPGDDWARSFLKRHTQLSNKFAENIKRSRADVSRATLKAYFTELETTLKDVESSNLVNYDETAFVDDAGKTKVSLYLDINEFYMLNKSIASKFFL